MTTSRRVLELAGASWDRALAAPLIAQLSDGRVDDETLRRYFVLECGFVQTAARVRAAAILRGPSLASARGHYAALGSLLGEQGTVLDRAESLSGGTRAGAPASGPGGALARRALEVAEHGTYAEILCCLLAAESLYGHWCRQAEPSLSCQPILTEWIALHTVAPFTEELAFLCAEFDALQIDGDGLTHLAALAGEILDLERDFHDAAYSPGAAS